jgi:putative DNA primase/helicase
MRIWDESLPLKGTLAERYLAARKCELAEVLISADVLRFHSACPFGRGRVPAMVARMQDVISGEPVGIHRTALNDAGNDKRKMPGGARRMLGSSRTAAIMFGPRGPRLGVAEGIETALSVKDSQGAPVWALMSSTGIANFPVLAGCEFLTIFADHDTAGLKAARTCAARYTTANVAGEVRYPPTPNTDWNDWGRENEY